MTPQKFKALLVIIPGIILFLICLLSEIIGAVSARAVVALAEWAAS